MKTIKVSEATITQLNWLVARCEGLSVTIPAFAEKPWLQVNHPDGARPLCPAFSTDWSQMGPIIDREKISIRHWDNTPVIHAYLPTPGSDWSEGQTSLIAAARCYVTSKLGATAAIPDEL